MFQILQQTESLTRYQNKSCYLKLYVKDMMLNTKQLLSFQMIYSYLYLLLFTLQ